LPRGGERQQIRNFVKLQRDIEKHYEGEGRRTFQPDEEVEEAIRKDEAKEWIQERKDVRRIHAEILGLRPRKYTIAVKPRQLGAVEDLPFGGMDPDPNEPAPPTVPVADLVREFFNENPDN